MVRLQFVSYCEAWKQGHCKSALNACGFSDTWSVMKQLVDEVCGFCLNPSRFRWMRFFFFFFAFTQRSLQIKITHKQTQSLCYVQVVPQYNNHVRTDSWFQNKCYRGTDSVVMPSAHSHLWSHLRFSPLPKQAGSICSIFVCLRILDLLKATQ